MWKWAIETVRRFRQDMAREKAVDLFEAAELEGEDAKQLAITEASRMIFRAGDKRGCTVNDIKALETMGGLNAAHGIAHICERDEDLMGDGIRAIGALALRVREEDKNYEDSHEGEILGLLKGFFDFHNGVHKQGDPIYPRQIMEVLKDNGSMHAIDVLCRLVTQISSNGVGRLAVDTLHDMTLEFGDNPQDIGVNPFYIITKLGRHVALSVRALNCPSKYIVEKIARLAERAQLSDIEDAAMHELVEVVSMNPEMAEIVYDSLRAGGLDVPDDVTQAVQRTIKAEFMSLLPPEKLGKITETGHSILKQYWQDACDAGKLSFKGANDVHAYLHVMKQASQVMEQASQDVAAAPLRFSQSLDIHN